MKKIFMFSIVFVFVLFLSGLAMAQTTEGNITPPATLIPGVVEDTGTHFEATNSEYLNVVLDSAESITLRLESIPEMVTMHVESASDAASTQITISGFQPLTTYYKYEDNYHNLVEITTDGNGSYSWTQDLSQSHLVFIQPRKSTKFIADNATGGDCTKIGTWDSATKTCTLTTDVYETIQIDSDYITLDGNGHTVTGTGTGYGVYLHTRMGVTIKNLYVKYFYYGIVLYDCSSNALIRNTSIGQYRGIFLWHSSNNSITDNIVSNNHGGIVLYDCSSNTIAGNIISNNGEGIVLYALTTGNTLTDNTILYGSCAINCYGTNNNTFVGNTIAYNSGFGLRLWYSYNNQIYNNNFINQLLPAIVVGGSNNIFNLEKPTGGNYWSNFDTPVEGCYDANNDGFCDSPYYFTGGADYLPWARQDGWEVPIDNIPPATTITLSGNLGNNNWYISDVQVTLTATDNAGGSGVKKIEYSFDGLTWNTYSSPFTITNEGTTTVYYKSTDNAWNVESQKAISINIDRTVPTIAIVTASPNILWPPNHKIVDVKIDGSAIDDESGIASVVITVADEYGIYNMTVPSFGSTIQIEAWREGTDRDGRVYTITVIATDNAGNQAAVTTQVIVPHDMGK